jgi:hypothetical protein
VESVRRKHYQERAAAGHRISTNSARNCAAWPIGTRRNWLTTRSHSTSVTRTFGAATTTTKRRQSHHDRRRNDQKLLDLKLATMAQAFRDLLEEPPGNQRSFTEKIAVTVEREWTDCDNRLARLLRAARLTINSASLENVWCERVAASTRPPCAISPPATGFARSTT